MIKSDGEYFDFDGDIQIESQVKLFEEIQTANGDYSYSFDLPKTSKNLGILGLPFPDTVKSIYSNVPCEIIDDSGFKIYKGSLQVNTITEVISCTFFGGNADWFGLLTNPLKSLPLYRYDRDLTITEVINSWSENSGLVFPMIDAGGLATRSTNNVKVEDFIPLFYVKTLFSEIFNPLGIKLQGDLIDDPVFQTAVIAFNGRSQEQVEARSAFVQKTTAQNALFNAVITFQNDSIFPYFDGSNNSYDTTQSRFTADVKARYRIELSLNLAAVSGAPNLSAFDLIFQKNGSAFKTFVWLVTSTPGTLNQTYDMLLDAGDYMDLRITVTAFNGLNISGGTIRITPIFIYKAFGTASVPNWTQGEFVSNILRLVNAVPSFNADSRTLTIDLFDKIKEKEPIDISDDVTITSTDFSEFVSDYGKRNTFVYQEGNDEDLREYNISNFVKYGDGELLIDNDFLKNSAEVVESDFSSPITYLNGVFDLSMERINYVDLEEIVTRDITSVTDSSGTPRFNIANADDYFTQHDIVKIETEVDGYNGEWIIATVTSTYITVIGLGFTSSTTGSSTLLRQRFTTDDNVYIFTNIANINVTAASSKTVINFNAGVNFSSTFSLAYFNLLSNGTSVNKTHKQSLAFGQVNSPLSYQITLLDTYWKTFEQVLADPVLITTENHFNRAKFDEIKTFLRPLRIKTNETNNLYYMNNHRGYIGGVGASEGKLIKL